MTTYGLTPTGFVPKSLSVVRADLDAAMRAAFGQSMTLGDKSVLGIIDAIMAERYAELWSLAQQVYSSEDPDAATGQQLDAISKITGTLRPRATYSTVTETLVGTPGTVVPIGTIINTLSTTLPFQTTISATLVLLASWAATTAYIVGTRVTNAGKAYQCVGSGVSAGSGGPTATSNPVPADGSVTWYYLGSATGATDTPMQASSSGATVAVAGDLTQIVTAVSGLTAAVNLLDAISGRDVAQDKELRLLRTAELSGEGASTADAIRAALLKLAGVISVTVFHNDTDTVDVNGLPPHSVNVLYYGPTTSDLSIGQILYAQVGAGIATVGLSSVVVNDSQNQPHTLNFTRPAGVNIYVRLGLTYDSTAYPSDGDAEVQAAIAAAGLGYVTALDVYVGKILSAAYSVPGVLGVDPVGVMIYNDVIGTPTAWSPTHAYVATPGARSVVTNDGGRAYICVAGGTSAGSGGPTGTGTAIVDGGATWYFLGNPYTITPLQLAVFDTSRITVTSTPATP